VGKELPLMAAISKVGNPSLASMNLDPGSQKLPALIAGESLQAGDACYVKSDGLIWRSTGAAANAAAKVRGFAPTIINVGEPVSLIFNVSMNYGSGLTPGIDVFLSGATAGGLDTASSTGGTLPVGFAEDATRIYLYQSRY
jgi:hypothetical protein